MIQDTLKQRGDRYGSYSDNAELTQGLLKLVTDKCNTLPKVHLETIHMIFHKISRLVLGDHWYADNAHDIAGYSTLLEEYINQANSNPLFDESIDDDLGYCECLLNDPIKFKLEA